MSFYQHHVLPRLLLGSVVAALLGASLAWKWNQPVHSDVVEVDAAS